MRPAGTARRPLDRSLHRLFRELYGVAQLGFAIPLLIGFDQAGVTFNEAFISQYPLISNVDPVGLDLLARPQFSDRLSRVLPLSTQPFIEKMPPLDRLSSF